MSCLSKLSRRQLFFAAAEKRPVWVPLKLTSAGNVAQVSLSWKNNSSGQGDRCMLSHFGHCCVYLGTKSVENVIYKCKNKICLLIENHLNHFSIVSKFITYSEKHLNFSPHINTANCYIYKSSAVQIHTKSNTERVIHETFYYYKDRVYKWG